MKQISGLKKWTALVLTATLLTMGAASCSTGTTEKTSEETKAQAQVSSQTETQAEEKKPEKLEKLTFVLDWTPNTNHTGLYVAQEKGYFKEAGLEVDIVQPANDSSKTVVGSGQAEFGVSFLDSLAGSYTSEHPLPITAVAAIMPHNTSGIVSLKDKQITRPKEMEGHRHASWENPIYTAVLKKVVEKDGGDFSKVEMIPDESYATFGILQGGQIDTVWIYYGWDGLLAKYKNIDVNYFNFIDIDPELDHPEPILIANNDFLQKSPELAKKFLEAAGRGYLYAVQHPEESAEILFKYAPEYELEFLKLSQAFLSQQYMLDQPYWGYINPSTWNGYVNWLNKEQLLPKTMPADTGFTNEYLDQKLK